VWYKCPVGQVNLAEGLCQANPRLMEVQPWESQDRAPCPLCNRTVAKSCLISWLGALGPPTVCLTPATGIQLEWSLGDLPRAYSQVTVIQ